MVSRLVRCVNTLKRYGMVIRSWLQSFGVRKRNATIQLTAVCQRVFFLVFVVTSHVQAQVTYHVAPVTVPDELGIYNVALNNVGEIVGTSFFLNPLTGQSNPHGFRSSQGGLEILPLLYVIGINDAGAIVGSQFATDGNEHAVLFAQGSVLDIGVLPGDTRSFPTAINNSGEIVGTSRLSLQSRPFLFANGTLEELPLTSGVRDINDQRQMLLSDGSAFSLYDNGAITSLPKSEDLVNDFPFAGRGFINNHSVVAASFEFEDDETGDINRYGVIYEADEVVQLGSLGADDIVGLNNVGQVLVGSSIYDHGVMTDLNSVLSDDSAGWSVITTRTINDLGWIIADATGPDGQGSLVLLTPVPEPHGISLCLGAVFGGGLWLRSSKRNLQLPRR